MALQGMYGTQEHQPLLIQKITRTKGTFMKKLGIFLFFLCSFAIAEDWFERPNRANGKIVLLSGACTPRPDATTMRRMYTTTDSGSTIWGCWNYWAGAVHVVYDDGQTYTYPPELFTFRQSK